MKLIQKKNPIALDALSHGLVLYDDGFWKVLQDMEKK